MSSIFEESIVSVSERIIDEYAGMLGQFGVRAEFRGLRVRTEASDPRCSEIEVVLYHGKDLLDVLEFFVVRNGKEVVNAEEVEVWLRRELCAIPVQHDLQPRGNEERSTDENQT